MAGGGGFIYRLSCQNAPVRLSQGLTCNVKSVAR